MEHLYKPKNESHVRESFRLGLPFQINTSTSRKIGAPSPSTTDYPLILKSREILEELCQVLKYSDKPYDPNLIRQAFVYASDWFDVEYQAYVEQKTTQSPFLVTLRQRMMNHTIDCLKHMRTVSGEDSSSTYKMDKRSMMHCAKRTDNIVARKYLNVERPFRWFNEQTIEVQKMPETDPLLIIKDLKDEGLTPCLIMAAHPNEATGTYQKDEKEYSDGIEEDVYRRTDMFAGIKNIHRFKENRNWSYQISEFGGIYVPSVQIFRAPEYEGYTILDPTKVEDGTAFYTKLDFVLSSPLRKPKTEPIHRDLFTGTEHPQHKFFSGQQLEASSEEKLHLKIESALMIARNNGHDCIVLPGPFGCFKCPPFHVAHILKYLLGHQRSPFNKKVNDGTTKFNFRKVVVCCKENPDAAFCEFGTYLPFKHVFSEQVEVEAVQVKEESSEVDDFFEHIEDKKKKKGQEEEDESRVRIGSELMEELREKRRKECLERKKKNVLDQLEKKKKMEELLVQMDKVSENNIQQARERLNKVQEINKKHLQHVKNILKFEIQ